MFDRAGSVDSRIDGRKRLDAALVERGLAPGREKAKAYIRAGQVTVNGRTAGKPSALVEDGDEVICSAREAYVGRGGDKLAKALETLEPSALQGATALDVGAATGGFTDCLLQHGAGRVYAVDVGHGQLHPSLAADERVVSLEGYDIRDGALAALIPGGAADIAVMDVAFISAVKVAPAMIRYLKPGAVIVCLVKPQFEAGRRAAGKRGVVTDPNAHRRAIRQVGDAFAALGCGAIGLTWSPVTGGDGNIEYLLTMRYNAGGDGGGMVGSEEHRVGQVVSAAFEALRGAPPSRR